MLVYSTLILSILQCCFINGLDDIKHLNVTVAVFSGRPDPVWQVPSTDPNYRTIKGMLDAAKKYYPMQMPPRLGYKGFLVQEGEKDQVLIVGPETQELQLKLLETMPRDLSGESSLLKDNLQQIREEMKIVKAEAVPSDATKSRLKRQAPDYLPQVWYRDPKIRRCNNCYNYANNRRTYTFAQPGERTNQIVNVRNPQTVFNAAQTDGLLPYNQPFAAYAGPGHIVALVVDRGVPNVRTGDFHWYRLDRQSNQGQRRWSHKPGPTNPTNKDNTGRRYILDPEHADRGTYTTFVGYMISGANVNINSYLYPVGCAP